jgi:cytidyltransferase-like protein
MMKLKYIIDIDNTICETPSNHDYTKCKPFLSAIKEINKLYDSGNHIIIFTSRGGESKKDWHDFTVNQLKKWGLNYHSLIDKNKPNGDIFIDDKAINALDWRKSFSEKKYGIISGYFNPVHLGHIKYINGAKKDCDYLIAIINNDTQVELKKSKKFMDENHRKSIIENLKSVDESIISIDEDKTQCNTLRFLREKFKDKTLTFYNSGDRKANNLEIAESKVCQELNIVEKILDLPKIFSSSDLLKI